MEILYSINIFVLKNTILIFYLRLFRTSRTRWLLWATICFNTLIIIVFFFVDIFQCIPINAYWINWDTIYPGKCMSIETISWVHSSLNIAGDIWMLGIALTQLHRLRLHWKKKVGAGLMFSVGLL